MPNRITPGGVQQVIYKCLCDCGNYIDVYAGNLRKGNTKSCGCLNLEKLSERRLIDLTGQRFGRLRVISRDEDQKHEGGSKSAMWLCKCDCGNEVVVNGNSLRMGRTKSCGCLLIDWAREHRSIDLAGKRFGRLVAIKSKRFVLNCGRPITKWLCKCDCGGEAWIATSALQRNKTHSCGCLLSAGEESVCNELSKYNIHFSRQYYFNNLKGPGGGYLYFDFAFFDENNNLIGLLEYQGKQHYEPQPNSDFGKYQREVSDGLKKQYCTNNNIILFEITYLDDIQKSVSKIINTLYGNLVPSLESEEGVTTISQEST